jgi:hypothetical protein
MRADFVEDAGFGEGEFAVEVVFAEQAEVGGVEAVEFAQGGDLGDGGWRGVGHVATLAELVAFGN